MTVQRQQKAIFVEHDFRARDITSNNEKFSGNISTILMIDLKAGDSFGILLVSLMFAARDDSENFAFTSFRRQKLGNLKKKLRNDGNFGFLQ